MSDASFLAYKSAALFAALALMGALQGFAPYRGSFRQVLRNWRVNVPLAALNSVLLGAVCGGCVCSAAAIAATRALGLLHHVAIAPAAQITFAVLLLDLVAWGWHRANHLIPTLWRLHAVHHSDVVFDASTALRFHPGELVVSLIVRLAVVFAFGLPVWGILAFEMVFGVCNVFVHGNVRMPARLERFLALAFVTPALHRRHHAVGASTTNYGTIFSWWDRVGGTYTPCSSADAVDVGLAPGGVDPFSLLQIVRMPVLRRGWR